jgi:hypothetical protein
MLSLQHCRRLLDADSNTLSDGELEVVREQLYSLATLLVNAEPMERNTTCLTLVKREGNDSQDRNLRRAMKLVEEERHSVSHTAR